MDVTKRGTIISLLIRLVSVAMGLIYWLFISSTYPIHSIEALTVLASGMLFAAWMPLGSVAHLNKYGLNIAQKYGFFSLAIGLIGIYVVVSLSFSPTIWESAILTFVISSACACERICLAKSVENKTLWKYYGFSSLCRAISIFYLYLFISDTKELVAVVAIADAIVRLSCFCFLCLKLQDKPRRRGMNLVFQSKITLSSLKAWLASSMQNSIYWLPLSFGWFTSANELTIARIQIFILGFASVFYVTDEALSIKVFNRFGFVTNRVQISCILSMCAAFCIIFSFREHFPIFDGFLISNFDALSFGVILITMLLLSLSWNGARVLNFHNLRREWNMSVSLFMFSLVLTISKVSPPFIVFVVSLAWHVFVIITYPRTALQSDNLKDQKES